MSREPHTPVLLRRLVAIHEALAGAGFDHAVGGAIALAVHVREPRFTADIDLNVIADPARPDELLSVLPPDVEIHATAADEIRRDGQTRLLWRDPTTPLDLFFPQHPTYHRLVADRAELWEFPGASIKVMTATDLMVFKSLFDRSKDWVDIESLVECEAGDAAEAAEWIAEFVGTDDPRFQRLRRIGPPR